MQKHLLDLLAGEVAHRLDHLPLGHHVVPNPERRVGVLARRFGEKCSRPGGVPGFGLERGREQEESGDAEEKRCKSFHIETSLT